MTTPRPIATEKTEQYDIVAKIYTKTARAKKNQPKHNEKNEQTNHEEKQQPHTTKYMSI